MPSKLTQDKMCFHFTSHLTVFASSFLPREEGLEVVGEEFEEEGPALEKYGICLRKISPSSIPSFFKIKAVKKIKENKIQI